MGTPLPGMSKSSRWTHIRPSRTESSSRSRLAVMARCHEPANIPVQRRQRGGTDGCAMYRCVIAHLGQLEHITSGQTEVLQRRAGDSATDIRFDDQFEYLNVVKVHLILFNFAYRFGWTEIPLLANNLVKCGPAIRRPSQNELLCTLNLRLPQKQAIRI